MRYDTGLAYSFTAVELSLARRRATSSASSHPAPLPRVDACPPPHMSQTRIHCALARKSDPCPFYQIDRMSVPPSLSMRTLHDLARDGEGEDDSHPQIENHLRHALEAALAREAMAEDQ